MLRYYFYCPKCGAEEILHGPLPHGTLTNIRDGYGTPIHHYECPRCHNFNAGYMQFGLGKMNELSDNKQIKYFRDVIGVYQQMAL